MKQVGRQTMIRIVLFVNSWSMYNLIINRYKLSVSWLEVNEQFGMPQIEVNLCKNINKPAFNTSNYIDNKTLR
jgi:hypothetical protein